MEVFPGLGHMTENKGKNGFDPNDFQETFTVENFNSIISINIFNR